MLKIFQKRHYLWAATKHSGSAVTCMITSLFQKIFLKMFDYFQNFQKLNPLKISRYMVFV